MSQEKLLYESTLIVEGSPNAPETISPGTSNTDIAQQAPKVRLARNVLTQSLPYMLGFVQPLTSPVSFVFGFQDRKNTLISHADFPPTNQLTPPTGQGDNTKYTTRAPADPMTLAGEQPGLELPPYDGTNFENPAVQASVTPPHPEDPVIIRRLVETDVREVVFDLTNEVIQDITALFNDEFPDILKKFIQEGGELYGFGESTLDTALENFFLPQMMNKAYAKINTDFISWADSTASVIGDVSIPTLQDMNIVFTAIGEMRERLAKNTNKSGSVFIIATPRIANYIAGTLGMTNSNGGFFLEKGKPNQNPHLNGFIGQFGDVKVYQYRGTRPEDESIIMGFDGENGPNTSSVYYHPYKEYFIQGGDDYITGQSNVFYRVRDAWTTNPLDVYDGSITSPEEAPNTSGTSQYLIKSTFTISEKAIN